MRRWIILAVVVILAVGGFFVYQQITNARQAAAANFQTAPAERGDLTATVGATGVVRASQSATLVWQTSGTVETVAAALGERVNAGQELAVLQTTSLPQNIILAQADLVSARRSLEDLLNSRLSQARALQAVEDAQQALDDARSPDLAQARALEAIATAQKAVENAERAVRWGTEPASESAIKDAEAQVVIAKDALDRAKERYEPYANRPEDNLTRALLQSQLSRAQQQYDAAVRVLNSLRDTTNPTDQAVSEADLATARAQLAQAQRDYERIKNGATPGELALLEAQLADAVREWERLKDGPTQEDVQAAEARVAAAQAALDQAHLTAPFAGVITQADVRPGDQAAPGSLAFRLDDLSSLLIDVQVTEVDINRIQPGQEARLTFDAILGKEYTGVVREVGLVGSALQGVVEFTVTIELQNADQDVKPGMTAAVNIVVEKLTGVLLAPNRAVRVLQGERVVYVLDAGGVPQPVKVVLGASSETNSQVVEGELKEGDPIVLNPPTVFESNGPPPFVRR